MCRPGPQVARALNGQNAVVWVDFDFQGVKLFQELVETGEIGFEAERFAQGDAIGIDYGRLMFVATRIDAKYHFVSDKVPFGL